MLRRSLVLCALAPLLLLPGPHAATPPAGVAPDPLLAGLPDAFPVMIGPGVIPTSGNEPVIRVAPDGTLYVAALHHLYRSVDGGGLFVEVTPPIPLGGPTAPSDSDVEVGPDGAVYYVATRTYLGDTILCMSPDKGLTWTCNPQGVRGPTDRMWLRILPDGRLHLLVFKYATHAESYVSLSTQALLALAPEPNARLSWWTGDHAQGGSLDGGSLVPSSLRITERFTAQGAHAGSAANGLRWTGIPSFARDAAGTLYGTDEPGNGLYLARADAGATSWTRVKVADGVVRFSAVAADAPGRVTILYYERVGPEAWVARVADTWDADAPAPTFSLRTVSAGVVHTGANICATSGCSGAARFAGDFISATFDGEGRPWYAWVEDARVPSVVVRPGLVSPP